MADSVFRGKSLRAARKMSSWLDCLVRGRRRRQQRRSSVAESAAVRVELLEDRALLTAAPFGPGTDVSTSADGARSIISADIDGDGDQDLVAALLGDDEIIWYENFLGDGSAYIPHMVTSMTDGVTSIAVADINGDGNLDIVSASRYDDKFAWFNNVNGDGTVFTETEINVATDDPRSVFLADIDDDGDIDVVTASYGSDQVAWQENTAGDGSAWTPHVVSMGADGAVAVSAADMDGDGDLDIIAASFNDNSIRWYSNLTGTGTAFSTNMINATVTGASALHVTDVDGDGDNDVVTAASTDDEVIWFESSGTTAPTFSEHVISTTADGVAGVSVADIDNDGDNDILSASFLDDSFVAYENDGDVFDPTFTARTLSSPMKSNGANTIIAADVDGDGDLDVVGTSGLDDTITIFKNNTIHKSAVFPVATSLIVPPTPGFPNPEADGAYTVTLGDMDGDGDLDIVSTSLYDSKVQWFRNDTIDPSEPVFNQFFLQPIPGVRDVEVYDIDGDGDNDIVYAAAVSNSIFSNTIGYLRNDDGLGLNFTIVTIANNVMAPRSVFVTDIDSDGTPDVLSASSFDDSVRWTGLSGGFFVTRLITNSADGARDVVGADVDGDGDIDAVVASYYDDRIVWYENADGAGTNWARRIIDTTANGARTVDTADIDGDGDIDIIAGSTYDHTVRWYENDGGANPTFIEHIISTSEQGVQDVAVADVDHDGDLDIISVAEFPVAGVTSRIAYFINNGAPVPTFTRADIDTNSDRPTAVAVGDLDRDGDLDVVSTSMQDDSIVFYANGGGQLGLSTEVTAPNEFVAGAKDDFLKITATHNGRAGDGPLELSTFELRLERTPGDPLSNFDANELIFNIDVWLDDGDGVYDFDDDTEVLTVDPLVVDSNGIVQIFFTDDDPNALIELGTPKVYFIVVESTAISFLLDPKTFVLTHVTETSSTVEDAVNDIPGTVDFAINVSTPLIEIAQPNVPIPGIPAMLGPIGEIVDTTPTIAWSAPTGAEQYDLMVYDVVSGQLVINQKGITGTSFTPMTPLPAGRTYQVFVQAINVGAETGGFSTPEYFAIDPVIPVPAVPVLTGPAPIIADTTPIITWTPSDTAVNYDLLIYNVRTGVEILNPKNVVGTSYHVVAPLAPDHPYQVFVRAKNAGGASNWSAPLHFDALNTLGFPASPILTGPAASIPDNTPTITWNSHPLSLDYELLIYSVTKGQEVLNVTGIAATEFTTASLAAPDTFQVFVRGRMSGVSNFTVYSPPLVFKSTSAAPIPATPTILTPSLDSTDGTPTFIWTDVAAASAYNIVAYNVSFGTQAFFATNQTVRHFIPGAPLVPGFYQVHVQSVNSAGETGAWSGPLNFRILSAVDVDGFSEESSAEPKILLEDVPELQPLSPEGETVPVSIELDLDDVNLKPAPVVTRDETIELQQDIPVAAEKSDLPTVELVEAETIDSETVATVMSAWPETDWWNDQPAVHEESAAISTAQASIAGVAIGMALPAVEYFNNRRTEKKNAAPRRSNRRKQQ